MIARRWLAELLLPGLSLYRSGRPIAAFVLIFLCLADGIGLGTYYGSEHHDLSVFSTMAGYDTTAYFMGLIPHVEETYLVFNPTEKGFDIRRATPIWPDNRPLAYPEQPLMAELYHGMAFLLLAVHFLLWRRWRMAP